MADELYQVVVNGWVVKKDGVDHPAFWNWKWENFVISPNIGFKKVQDLEEGEPFLRLVQMPGSGGLTMNTYVEKETYDKLKEEYGDLIDGTDEADIVNN